MLQKKLHNKVKRSTLQTSYKVCMLCNWHKKQHQTILHTLTAVIHATFDNEKARFLWELLFWRFSKVCNYGVQNILEQMIKMFWTFMRLLMRFWFRKTLKLYRFLRKLLLKVICSKNYTIFFIIYYKKTAINDMFKYFTLKHFLPK